MAKVTVEFDTVEKTLDVAIDGKRVENVVCVTVCQGYPRPEEYSCEITSGVVDEDNDMRSYTRVSASQTTAGEFRAKAKTLAEEMESYFGKSRR